MGFFDRFRKPKPEDPDAPEADPDPPLAVVVVREGLSTPSEDEMRALLVRAAPALVEVPRRGLAQPRWWRQEDWLASGMRGIAASLHAELEADPAKTTWRVVSDDKGAKIAIVSLYR